MISVGRSAQIQIRGQPIDVVTEIPQAIVIGPSRIDANYISYDFKALGDLGQ